MAETKRTKVNILFNEEYTLEFTTPKTESEVREFITKQHPWMHWKPISEISDEGEEFSLLLGLDVPSIIADLLTLDSYKESGKISTVHKEYAGLLSEVKDLSEENEKLKKTLATIDEDNLNRIKETVAKNEAKLQKLQEDHEKELEKVKKLADDTVAEFEKKYKKFADKAVDSVGILKSFSLLEYMQRIDQLQQDLIQAMQDGMRKEGQIFEIANKLAKSEDQFYYLKNAIFKQMERYQVVGAKQMIEVFCAEHVKNHPDCPVGSFQKVDPEKVLGCAKCAGFTTERAETIRKLWEELVKKNESVLPEIVIVDKGLYDKLAEMWNLAKDETTIPKLKGIFKPDAIFSSNLFKDSPFYAHT